MLDGWGAVIAAGSAAAAILLPAGRLRALTMLLALVLFPLLILGDQWHSPQIVDLRDNPLEFIGLGAGGGAPPPASFPGPSSPSAAPGGTTHWSFWGGGAPPPPSPVLLPGPSPARPPPPPRQRGGGEPSR